MKTAMTDFLEWLENSSDVQNDILNWETVKENALEKEKEQIMDSYLQGSFDDGPNITNSEQYYNQTYNQQ
jgi:hypothetical protein